MLVMSTTAASAAAALKRFVWPTVQLVMKPPYSPPPLTNIRLSSAIPRPIRSSQQAITSS